MSRRPRPPFVFLGPNGVWDVIVFASVEEACAEAEPPDVLGGEYGDYGWDADGRGVKLVVIDGDHPLARWLGIAPMQGTQLVVMDGTEPVEDLREVLLRRLASVDPERAAACAAMDVEGLLIESQKSELDWADD